MRQPQPASREPAVLVQLGGELACALTRGWLDAAAGVTDLHIICHDRYGELLDGLGDPARLHRLHGGPLSLLRLRRQLRVQPAQTVLCLHRSWTADLICTAWPGDTVAKSAVLAAARPAEFDAAMGIMFARLGIEQPQRRPPLPLTRATLAAADGLLRRFGFSATQAPHVIAPCGPGTALARERQDDTTLPVVLLPTGRELEFISRLGGRAFLVRAPSLPLRAALIRRAATLLTDHDESAQLATLMGTPVLT